VFGIVLSLTVGFASVFALGGAGHGWCSSAWSFLTVLFLPVLGVGFVTQDSKSVRQIAWYVTLACVVVDAVLVISTSFEGWFAILRVWDAVPSLLGGWVILWTVLYVCIVLLWWKTFRVSE
jgi:hypothetical protein